MWFQKSLLLLSIACISSFMFEVKDANAEFTPCIKLNSPKIGSTCYTEVPYNPRVENSKQAEGFEMIPEGRPDGLLADLINRIKSASEFTVTFDQVGGKFNDSGWTGNTDPMGTLKAGETYRVIYSRGRFTTTGFNEGYGGVISAIYDNANPDESKVSLWGRVYTFDEKGNVYDPQFGLVGTLRF